MMEEWISLKGVVECGDNYEVSNYGNVRNVITKKLLKPRLKRGYLQVVLYLDGRRKNYNIHRLVALAFMPNKDRSLQVNHKDGNKQNNKLANLEWVTVSENLKHAFKTGLISKEKHRELMKKLHAKPVTQFSKSGEVINTFESISEASRKTGVRPDTIALQCKFNRMSRKYDFYFRYSE
jgi:hypothetical protein